MFYLKATSDVTGEEFEKFIEVLGKLHHLSRSVDGIQQIIDIITEQAELQGDFQVSLHMMYMYIHVHVHCMYDEFL